MMRAPSSTSKVGATMANAVPSRNRPIAVAYALRVDTRCRNQPVIGITAAMVSMKAVESHCAVCSVMFSAPISSGIALIMIVSLRMTTNVASTSSRITAGVRPEIAVADLAGESSCGLGTVPRSGLWA